MSGNVYLCIDLKSFYASAECVARGLDPMRTNLVVADASRTQKTICLAVSPALKSYGLPGRLRLFEVEQRVKDINYDRRQKNGGRSFRGKSWNKEELERNLSLELDYIVAVPRMAYYMECSGKIYQIYLNHIAPEDIHVYSIDEVFIDLTPYLDLYKTTPRELASRIIQEVYEKTAITATAGLGSNLYLAKIAMDILAKRMPADERGACIAELDEMSYREQLWGHQPITDFWRIGRGYAKKLNDLGLRTMGDIARYSLQRQGEDTLYKVFGVNAELLIDHAWGWEPCGMQDIKNYRPEHKSFGSGQVLQYAYTAEKARIVVWEMVDRLVLDLVDKKMVADQFVLTIGYDIDNLSTKEKREKYMGQIVMDHYGRSIPKHAHGTVNLKEPCNSMQRISNAVMKLFDDIVDRNLLVRRITIAANHVLSEKEAEKRERFEQLDLFRDLEMLEREKAALEKERHLQKAILKVQKKYGKNALLKGTNFMEGATMQSRNEQIGGHKA
ncbi:MAG: DNA methylase [Anaerotignum sp.]|nr:DNA methylase [Anaerotignum sp.]